MFGTDLLLQLKISHGLANIDVIHKSIVMYISITYNLVTSAIIF
jgi:hypothetical protein